MPGVKRQTTTPEFRADVDGAAYAELASSRRILRRTSCLANFPFNFLGLRNGPADLWQDDVPLLGAVSNSVRINGANDLLPLAQAQPPPQFLPDSFPVREPLRASSCPHPALQSLGWQHRLEQSIGPQEHLSGGSPSGSVDSSYRFHLCEELTCRGLETRQDIGSFQDLISAKFPHAAVVVDRYDSGVGPRHFRFQTRPRSPDPALPGRCVPGRPWRQTRCSGTQRPVRTRDSNLISEKRGSIVPPRPARPARACSISGRESSARRTIPRGSPARRPPAC
jgi:hypothetical protein